MIYALLDEEHCDIFFRKVPTFVLGPTVNFKYIIVTCLYRLCGLVVRVSGYRYRGPGFDSRRYQIF